MANTTKHDLIAEVSKSTGLTQADTKIVVEELLGSITTILETDKSIEIRGIWNILYKSPQASSCTKSQNRRNCTSSEAGSTPV